MKPWREIAVPHRDVLEGTFLQSEFAADITAVRAGTASREYLDTVAFFERTYITERMRQLLMQVAQRLAGHGGAPVIQLQTAFGGGKTHTMLAVYHLATRRCALSSLAGAAIKGGTSTGDGTTDGTGGSDSTMYDETGTEDTDGGGIPSKVTVIAAKLKSFHGSIQIKHSAAKMHLVQVAEEIINQLASDPTAVLNITLEISAEFPTGASDQIKRAVTENAASLGFKTKTWE